MRITYASTLLTRDGAELAFGISVNGEQIIDEAGFFGAASRSYFGRGLYSTTLDFSVRRFFNTSREAEVFVLTHFAALPNTGDVQVTCGSGTDLQVCRMVNAVISAVPVAFLGLSVVVRYTLKGGVFYTEDVPTPDSSADLVKAINQVLTSGTTSQAIAFDTAFATPPRALSLNLSAPDNGATFGFQVRESTRTAAGFTVDFDAAVPASGYKLTGIALL